MPDTATRPLLILAALLVAGLLLGACAAEEEDEPAEADPDDAEAADDDADEVSLTFAHSYTTDHPHHRCGAELVAESLEEQDLGLSVQLAPDSQLGGDTDRISSVMAGDIDLDIQGSSALGASYEPIGVLDSAYTVEDAEHLFEFFDGDESQQLEEDFLAETDVRILGPWYFGMRHFTANDSIQHPDDLQGLRMRFPDSPIYLANAEALGADATAVAFEEVFLSLQQGVIDGQENPIPTVDELNLPEVQSHLSMTGHQTGSQMVIISEQTWGELSDAQQEALEAAVLETQEDNRTCIEEDEERLLDEWADTGDIEVVDDVDVETFRQQANDYFAEDFDGDSLEVFEAIRGLR